MLMAKLTSTAAVIDGDAPIAAPASAMPGGALPHGERTRPLDTSHNNQPPSHRAPKRKVPPAHHADATGLMTHNRAGKRLCVNYIAGNCNQGASCPDAHQCSRCLQPQGNCSTPGSCSAQLRASRNFTPRSGKGGKGKGKGKGGKRY